MNCICGAWAKGIFTGPGMKITTVAAELELVSTYTAMRPRSTYSNLGRERTTAHNSAIHSNVTAERF
jgi:hypothetical protein